jgi:hypothetical protein
MTIDTIAWVTFWCLGLAIPLAPFVMTIVVPALAESLILRDALGEPEPRRLASGGTGSCVAVPSTEVEG